jgi:predicted lactoylglutathione lyase
LADAGEICATTLKAMIMTPQRVSLITLGVADLARAKTFYAALGWIPTEELPEVVFYQINGMALGFFGMEHLARDQGRPDSKLGVGGMTLGINFETEAEVDQAFAQALDAGATCLKAPEKVFWGGYSGYYADPDGHVWETSFNPFWPLEADGSLTLPEQADAS